MTKDNYLKDIGELIELKKLEPKKKVLSKEEKRLKKNNYYKLWIKNHPNYHNKFKEKNLEYKKNHREEANIYFKQYYINNKELISLKRRLRYLKSKESNHYNNLKIKELEFQVKLKSNQSVVL